MITWDHFVKSVVKYFRFLEDDFGFSVITSEEPFIVYGLADVRVNVYCDVYRHSELDLGLERASDMCKGIPFFRIYEFKKLQGIPSLSGTAPFLETDEQMDAELQKLAYELKLCCSDVLHGDLKAFDQIERQRKG
jgi:hypothetical protein